MSALNGFANLLGYETSVTTQIAICDGIELLCNPKFSRYEIDYMGKCQ